MNREGDRGGAKEEGGEGGGRGREREKGEGRKGRGDNTLGRVFL